jgi:hypothetical protein
MSFAEEASAFPGKYAESSEEFGLRYYDIFPNFVKFSSKNPL